jgi:hypothetical protein
MNPLRNAMIAISVPHRLSATADFGQDVGMVRP